MLLSMQVNNLDAACCMLHATCYISHNNVFCSFRIVRMGDEIIFLQEYTNWYLAGVNYMHALHVYTCMYCMYVGMRLIYISITSSILHYRRYYDILPWRQLHAANVRGHVDNIERRLSLWLDKECNPVAAV